MKFGYARVSTQNQSLSLQIDALQKYKVDQIFEEKESGKKKDRPRLEELLKGLRKGDTVVVYKPDRISRSTKHLIELMECFEEKRIHFAVSFASCLAKWKFNVSSSYSTRRTT